ncbi:hypothetical protein MRB53_027186 [Persea americana]|uniref:Uncharacterized protein n=1 Tax=Persea americana TaxID=3435 RepID=A0ACC2LKE8_PERAE|nr:hypothetical protein MRB53_027186 [Persea americana]
MALSNTLIGCINFIAMVLSVPVIFTGFALASRALDTCVKLLQWPIIILGILILVVAVTGFVGGFWRIRWLMFFYFVAMLIAIILLAGLIVFVYMITNKGSGHPVPNRAFLEYQLDDYSGWLRRRVVNPFRWDHIKGCLNTTTMCAGLNQRYRFAQDFFDAQISPIQSGCCKPPTLCGYTFVNPTYWTSPNNTGADIDCLMWSNEQTQLCYACDSCKAGLLASLKSEWRRADLILAVTLVGLICVYLIGCCWAFSSAKKEDPCRRHKQSHEQR